MANNEKIKDAGVAPVEQTYGETWTSQLFVLGDFHNVAAAVPNFAADYTANKAKYATTPAALAGFEHMQQVYEAGYFNKDFASAELNDGIKAVATGNGCALSAARRRGSDIETVAPGKAKDVGFFALPGNDAAKNRYDGLAGNIRDVHPEVGGGRQARCGEEVHRVRGDAGGL